MEKINIYEEIKDRIFIRLLPEGDRTSVIEELYTRRLIPGIEIGFNIMLDEAKDGVMSVKIDWKIFNNYLAKTELSQDNFEDLFLENAKESTYKLFPPVIDNMENIICEMLGREYKEVPEDLDQQIENIGNINDYKVPMIVLTNRQRTYGANLIIRKDLLQKVAEKLGSNVYILPSSRHEVILVPTSDLNIMPSELKMLVKEINVTEVKEDDYLSDDVYYYSIEEKDLFVL